MTVIETPLHCKKCNRYLGKAIGNAAIDELICAKCKNRNKFIIRVDKIKKEEKQDER